MSLVLNVEILGEFKKLTAATQGANKQLSGLQGAAKKISSGIGKAFATIGVGLSFAFIARELEQASKAAVEDAKSQGLLATALKNTTGANNAQISSVEKAIGKMSIQAAVADDQLRPAFAQLARATGDVEKSTKLMSLALDVSAGTGKSLDVVVKALSRAVGPDGTTGALERLAPAIKGASDPLAELERLFAGSAEKAANLDPYQRLNVALGEISESLGTLVVPLVEAFAVAIVDILPKVQNFFNVLNNALNSPQVQKAFESLNKSFGDLGASLAKLFGITAGPEAKGFIGFFVVMSGILEGIVKTVDLMVQGFKNAFPIFRIFSDLVNTISTGLVGISGYQAPTIPGQISTPQSAVVPNTSKNVTININKGNVTAKEIAKAVNKGTKTTGSPSITSAALRQ
ncbi:MAG: hypothetical protein ACK5S6_03005, partial [bacterium]